MKLLTQSLERKPHGAGTHLLGRVGTGWCCSGWGEGKVQGSGGKKEGERAAPIPQPLSLPPSSVSLPWHLLSIYNEISWQSWNVVFWVLTLASQSWNGWVGLELKDNYLITGKSSHGQGWAFVSHTSQHMSLTHFLSQARWALLSFLATLQCLSFPHSHCYISMGYRWPGVKVSLQTKLRNEHNMTSACRAWDSALSTSLSWVPRKPYSTESWVVSKHLPRDIWCVFLLSLLSLSSSSLSHVFTQAWHRHLDTSSGVWPLQKGIIWFLGKGVNIR